MKKFNKKMLNVVTTTALVASVVAPMAAFADSKNVITTIPSIADDYESSSDLSKSVSEIIIKEENVPFVDGKIFRLTLPSGVKFHKENYQSVTNEIYKAEVVNVTDQTLELKTKGFNNSSVDPKEQIKIPMWVKVDGATGDLKVNIESMDTTITPGSYTFAVAGSGKTTAVAEEIKSISSNGKAGTIRIDENSLNAVGDGKQDLTIKLPTGFEWDGDPEIEFSGGFNVTETSGDVTAGKYKIVENKDRTLKIEFQPNSGRSQRGTIYIKNPSIKVDDAKYGDVEVNVSGSKISDADLKIATYADWGGGVKVKEVKELVAGKVDDVNKTEKITIEESVTGSFIGGRDIDIELPSWVKVVGVTDFSSNSVINGDTNATKTSFGKIDGSKNKVSIKIGKTNTSTTKGKVELKLVLSVQGDKSGDIEAVIKGAGLEEQKLVVAKAVAPVTVQAVKAADVKIGLQDQDAPDFVITENRKEAIEKTAEEFKFKTNGELEFGTDSSTSKSPEFKTVSGNGVIEVVLPSGVSFASTPKVEVVDGNGEIEKDNITRESSNGVNNVLRIPVKSESSKPMQIKVSGVKLTVDRTVPEGKIEAKVGGSAIIENKGTKDGQFNTENSVKFVLAKTVTPAPTGAKATVVFKIDESSYTVDGVEKTADVAPFIQNGRTFLPIRFVADAVGVTEDNIIWNDSTRTVTLIKGDRIAQIKIGSKDIVVNGVNVPMDVAAFIKDGRTVLPLRYVAQVLGADIQWDEATRSVTVN